MMMTLLMAGLFAGFAVWSLKKRARDQAAASGILRDFLEKTGYRVASVPDAPIDEHVRLAMAATIAMGGPEGHEWVRDCGGTQVRHFFRAVNEGNTNYYWCTWTAPLAKPPRFGLQIVDRRLIGALGKVDNFVANRKYSWEKHFHSFEIGDPELDKRFLFLSDAPAELTRIVNAAGVRELLLACKQVDLYSDAQGIHFTDPFRENLLAAFGGSTGALMSGYDPKAMMAATLPVHERIGWLVAGLARESA